MPKEVTRKNFQVAVLNQEKPVVVYVWADWCGPCHMLAPHFAAAEKELEGKARFVKLDADKNRQITKKYQVMGLPTLLYFKNGELAGRTTGVTTKNNIVKNVVKLLDKDEKTSIKTSPWWKFW